jgi:ribosomal protein S27AE
MGDPDGPYKYYGDDSETMAFVRRCPTCGRIVKADSEVTVNGFGEYVSQPNAECSKCGRVEMDFQGFV